MQGFDIDVILEYWPEFLRGAEATIIYSLLSLSLASVIGLLVAFARISHLAPLVWLARAYVGTEDGPFLIYRRRRFVSWLSDQLFKARVFRGQIGIAHTAFSRVAAARCARPAMERADIAA